MVKRLLNILLNFVTVLSLLLVVITGAFWVRSHSHRDELQYDNVKIDAANGDNLTSETKWHLTSAAGGAWLYTQRSAPHMVWDGPEYGSLTFTVVHGDACMGTGEFERFGIDLSGVTTKFGFAGEVLPSVAGMDFRAYRVPYYAMVIATGVLPALRLSRVVLKKVRKKQQGRCRKCGYDLRATPLRCPECGTEPELAKANP